MKKSFYNLFWRISFVLLIFCLNACVKSDLGSYDSDAVNNFVIDPTSFENDYILNLNDTLRLEAKITESHNDGEFTYQWYYYLANPTAETAIIPVGNTFNLDLPLSMSEGQYTLVLEVTDHNSGLKSFKKSNFMVKRLTSEGWLLFTWKDAAANLSIVTSQNEIYKDFMPTSENYPITGKPERLSILNDWDNTANGVQNIIIKTSDSQLYFLDFKTFEVLSTGLEAFAQHPGSEVIFFGTDMYFNAYYLWDATGKVYQVNRSNSNKQFNNAPNGFSAPLTGEYTAAPLIMPTITSYPVQCVFYDNSRHRFIYQLQGGTALLDAPATPANAAFDLNNFTDDILYSDIGSNSTTYLVGKNALGQYHLYAMLLDDLLDTYPAISKDLLEIQGDNIHLFAISGKVPLLYYVNDGALYQYRITEKTTIKMFTFPTDEMVVDLKMFRETIMTTDANNPNVNNQLVVASNKGDEGIFYKFTLSPTGMLATGSYSNRTDGFDAIINVAYKEQR